MTYLLLTLTKIVDNIIITAKTIATYKEKKIISSILVVISQILFYTIISQIINDKSALSILIVSISSGIGNYIAMLINEKLKKDSQWTIAINSNNIEDVKRFCRYLKNAGIEHQANYGFDENENEESVDTINIIAFSKTKQDSRMISSYIESSDYIYTKQVV